MNPEQGTPDPVLGFETRAIHSAQEPDPSTGAVVPTISLASTFAQRAVGHHVGFEYSRTGNPTRSVLEAVLAELECARGGALAFASGMAAEDAVLHLLRPGEEVVLGSDAYGGTYRLIERVWRPLGVASKSVDLADPAAVADAIGPATRMVWVETPSNPLLAIADIAEIATIAHRHRAIVVVDNTFATPYLQRPLQLGADIVVHSATKYLGGHSDVVGGLAAFADRELAESVAFFQNALGAVPSPFDCYLVLRGIKTLAVRMDRACASATAIAADLAGHPAVARVSYPGLPDHPGHAVATRQMRDFGGMVSFVLAGGEAAALHVARSTSVFTLAESLGAVESLIEHPHRMTHASVAGSPLAVDPGLIRLSVGLETLDDLVADLRGALDSLKDAAG